MAHKAKTVMDTTDNSSVYRKAEKEYRANNGIIHCSYCPYNRNENYKRNKRKPETFRDWEPSKW